MIRTNTLRHLLGVGLVFGACLAMRADEAVTFQVDLSRYTNSAGQQAATLVDVRGAFNGWGGGWTLINNGANVYTNTFTVIGTTGDKSQYKFTYSTCAGVTWEDNNPPPGTGQPPAEGNNRVLQLVGADQTLPVVPLYAPSVTTPINLVGVDVTYRVDLTAQIETGNFLPGSGDIRVTGAPAALTSWGVGIVMTNDPSLSGNASNIYSAVASICGASGGQGGAFKFRMNSGWEELGDGGDRNFTIAGGSQVLPAYYYFDQPPGPITNANVKFQVDMTPQVISGGFTNGQSTITVSGLFNGWGTGTPMTNDPALSGPASNIYSTTISIANPAGAVPTTTVGLPNRYKYRADSGWESAAIYGVGQNKDRKLVIAGGDQVLPLVTYNDASLCDVLLQPTLVTFVVHLPNGRLDNNGIPFDKANDSVYINGEFLGWVAWSTATMPQMTNNPIGSDFYEVTLPVPSGSRRLQYKFGIDGPGHGGLDNENPTYSDHVKYVRGNGATYTLPVSEFGNLFLSSLVEPAFGNLAAGAASNGNVPISWLGGPCITLQTRANVASGTWIDHPATDALGSTNWPASGTQQYFRLQKRPLP